MQFSFRKKASPPIEEKAALPLSSSDPALLSIFGAIPSASGVTITAASAMRVPAVKAAVELVAGTVGTLPAKVFSRLDKGGKEPALDHQAYSLVHDDANGWTSAGQLRTDMTIDAMLHGHGYASAERSDGIVHEFIRLEPHSVSRETTITGEPILQGQNRAGRQPPASPRPGRC